MSLLDSGRGGSPKPAAFPTESVPSADLRPAGHAAPSDERRHDAPPDEQRHAAPPDERGHARAGWAIVLVGVVGAIAWSMLAPLDQGVPAPGTVVVEGLRKVVQHPGGGIVDEILVHEGDAVAQGQVLVRMNTVQAGAEAESARMLHWTARAFEARLLAERDGAAAPRFPALFDEPGAKADARVAALLEGQRQLFHTRRGALRAELAALAENQQGLEAQLAGTARSRDEKLVQLASLTEQLKGVRALAADEYLPRNRLLETERLHAQVSGAIGEDTGTIGRLQRQVAELRLRRVQREQEYQREVRTQLADVQRDAAVQAERLAVAEFALANAQVRSPADGTVVGLGITTRGAVIAPGTRLMDVIPVGQPLEIDAQLPVHLVDKVHPGLPVEMIFSALNQRVTPHVPGEVLTVSADRLVDEATRQPYYKVRARVSSAGMTMLAEQKVRPGMPVELLVTTGERSFMNYLVRPLLDRAHRALREQ